MILYPNAKINLGLNIESKRSDGYHNMSSVFYPIYDCFDILEIVSSNSFLFTSSGISIPGSNNLCTKAYDLLKLKFNIPAVHIHLHKKIPIGAGLGGGSSDGAFVLKGLNDLFKLNISNKTLKDLALELGADCPFFIENEPKYITGIGDLMENIKLDLSMYEIRLVDSKIHINTKNAYSNIVPKSQKLKLSELIRKPIRLWKDLITNDFEQTVFKNYPKLSKVKENLYEKGAIFSSMTGTGSTIYGLFKK
ncbi:MAG: 4-(cytidine 5'-diphospho)-2-C-methyl-D-erythritol kinase [Flavobacteriales bacterium]|nr:4-(cytidine 5'-diphospho)-2-C-methyl-D-erythritol kinase [Flavobacteriales bacterium]